MTTDTPSIEATFGPLGEMTALMAQSGLHKHRSVEDSLALVLPAIALGQFRVWRRAGLPVAFATWAFLDTSRETAVLHENAALTIADWATGPRPVVMDVVAPYGDGFAIGRDLARTVFPETAFTCVRRQADGAVRKVVHFPGRDADGHWTRARAIAA